MLGFGGFGMTYLGFDHNLDKPIAIKEYLPSDIATRTVDRSVAAQASEVRGDFQWGLERFVDEARTLARFDHRHIIKVHRFFEAHGTAYIVMEYAEGETLSAHLERKGSLSEAELKAILYPLLDGLAVVHGADFLHRDIKPGNIVLRDVDGSPVLLDFGAARQAIGAKSRSVTSIVTPGYAPIEQYSTRGRQGAWTDIYALGGVCYRALTGDVPEDATDRMRDDPLVPVSQRCAGRASAAFLSAVDWALSVDEGDRPQGVGAWREAMEGDVATAAEKAAADDAISVRRGPSRRMRRFSLPAEKEVETAGQQAHRQEAKKGIDSEIADSPVATPSAAEVEDEGRLNKWFKLHCICLCVSLVTIILVAVASDWMSRSSKHTMIFIMPTMMVLTFMSGSPLLYKLWSLIPTHKARTTPEKAVAFLLLPLFDLYWNFVAIHGLASDLNAKTGRKSVSEVVSFIYCYSFVVAEVAGLLILLLQRSSMQMEGILIALIAPRVLVSAFLWEEHDLYIASMIFVIGWFVLWFVMLRQMKNAGILILQAAKE